MLTLNSLTLLQTTSYLSMLGTELALSNERLTTGYKVNRASDDPSGIVAISNLDSQIAKIDASTANGTRISSIIDTADGALSEIEDLLDTIETNVTAASSGSATAEEIAAYQTEIDEALDSLDRLATTTAYDGTTLLDGNIGYTTTGVTSTDITDLRINSATSETTSLSASISVTAAEQAEIGFDLSGDGWLLNDVDIRITGPDGTADITLLSGSGFALIRDKIDEYTATTGVYVEYVGGETEAKLVTQDYGDAASITASVLSDPSGKFDFYTSSDTGTDAVVTVNGAGAQVDDTKVIFNSNGVSGRFNLTSTMNQNGGTSSFTVSGNGANWSLGTSSVDRIHFGQEALSTSNLGSTSLGFLSSLASGGTNDLSSENFTAAGNIIDEAQNIVSADRGRLGAIKNYAVDATVDSLADAKTALTSAKSYIQDIDYATESANNTRIQTLIQIGTTLVASVNSTTQSSILTLLGRVATV